MFLTTEDINLDFVFVFNISGKAPNAYETQHIHSNAVHNEHTTHEKFTG